MERVDAKKLGELLREQREGKNLSLKEVENAISIRMSYLKAIEEGEVVKVISPVYAQGFVRQYALFLGLNGEELIKEYQTCFGPTAHHEFDYGIGTLEQRHHPGATIGWMPVLFYTVATVGMLAVAWYFAHFLGVI